MGKGPGGLFSRKPPPLPPEKAFDYFKRKFFGGPGGDFTKKPPGISIHFQELNSYKV
jgi:hypothetical protein